MFIDCALYISYILDIRPFCENKSSYKDNLLRVLLLNLADGTLSISNPMVIYDKPPLKLNLGLSKV